MKYILTFLLASAALWGTVLQAQPLVQDAPYELTPGEMTLAKRCFVNRYSYNTGQENWCLVAGDFDKDNNIDLVTASKSSDLLQIMYNDGTGEFNGWRSFHGPRQQRALCAIDANKDGWLDVVGITLLGQISVFLNDKKGGFTPPQVVETDRMAHSICPADMNNDGSIDLLVTAVNESSVLIFNGNGDGTFNLIPKAIQTGSKPRVVRTADFNKDNRLDLVVGCDDGYVYVHLNDNKNEYTRQTMLRANADNWGLAVADFNHDGRPDIASASYQERTLCIHLNKHDTVFVRSQSIVSGEHNFDLVANDFDKDGDIDVMTCSANDEVINLHLNNGDGTLDSRLAIPSGRWNSCLLAMDMDGDGDSDVITASILDKSINIHRNIEAELKPSQPSYTGIYGKILNQDIHEPIAYQPITLLNEAGQTVKTTLTNNEGNYVFYVPSQEMYMLRVRHNVLPPFRCAINLDEDSLLRYDIPLSRTMGATLVGKVQNMRNGETIAQAHIEIIDREGHPLARLSADKMGVFRQYIPFGVSYQITISQTDYKPLTMLFDIAATDGGHNVEMNLMLHPDISSGRIVGSVTDAMLGTPLPETFVVVRDMAGEEVTRFTSDETGRYSVGLGVGAYQLFIYKKGYFYSRHFMRMEPQALGHTQEMNLVLPRIRSGTNIILNELTYAENESSINQLPQETLTNLLRIMQDNSAMVVEIAGHTDATGDLERNVDISQKRAENIVRYLTEKGVSPRRLKAKGYGESMPIADNSTQDGRQQNRRIEFRILSY